MIFEYLATGKENARTARELAKIINCTPREVTAQIERERREGRPICASCGSTPGYYLPESDQELNDYCECLKSRAVEIFRTRQALVKVLKQITQTKQETGKP